MTPAEIEAALRVAFNVCNTEGYPLTPEQQRLLLQAVTQRLGRSESTSQSWVAENSVPPAAPPSDSLVNPLDELSPDQRQAFLQFVQEFQESGRSWKAQLLNDWLRGDDSGRVQFVRDQFGLQWLERVQPKHVAAYAEGPLRLKVGDRIEVANSLWEWVQEEGPCSREWFACTVVAVVKAPAAEPPEAASASQTSCCVRFDNGMEYEIQGIYEWNRYNWRWANTEAQEDL
ncbi:MAG: hypothetical protein D6742_18575 [Cyanobacteria bacterium J069]|nr:MAG: hypothetical protein D6742_18575 [Cyanobacteria bacterium J069]